MSSSPVSNTGSAPKSSAVAPASNKTFLTREQLVAKGILPPSSTPPNSQLSQRNVAVVPATGSNSNSNHPVKPSESNSKPSTSQAKDGDTFTVKLENARQYDDNGDRPPACTIHALAAMVRIGRLFDSIAMHIRVNSDELSGLQREIVQDGLAIYNEAKKTKPDLQAGADLQHIKELPKGLSFGEIHDEAGEKEGSFDRRLDKLVEALYANTGNNQAQVVWIKNGNDESFSVIKSGTEVIIFDSHQNHLILTQSQEATRAALAQKLRQYSNDMQYFDPSLGREITYDATPFAYAVGNFDPQLANPDSPRQQGGVLAKVKGVIGSLFL